MKKLLLIFAFVFLANNFLFSQVRSIEIVTYEQAAAFIPYINGEKKSEGPVMSYKYETDKDEKLQVLIHFEDPYTADIYRFIDFTEGVKNKKYEIVFRKKAKLLKKYEGINKNKQRPAYEKFELKDLSFQNYLKNTLR